MLAITLDLDTGLAKLAAATTIKAGAGVPVTIFTVRGGVPVAPGASPSFQLALGTDAEPPVLVAYCEDFAAENASTFTGILAANDARLLEAMEGQGQTPFGCELAWTADSRSQVAPTFTVAVQPRIITGGAASEGGPGNYYTRAEVDALLAGIADFRFLRAVTGYTGGGSANLDGLATAGQTFGLVEFIHATHGRRAYVLVAGTAAEDAPGIIRPDDYHATTNAFTWRQV